jgi:hypothetical protein
MPLLIKKSKTGLKKSLKSAGMLLPHGYEIKRRKKQDRTVTKRKKTIRKKTVRK